MLPKLKRPWGPKKGIVLCDPMDCSTPGFPVLHYLPEFAQTQCSLSRWCHPANSSSVMSSLSPLALNLSEHQGLFQWVGSLHRVARVLELQLKHQSFQWIFKVDFLKDWLVFSLCCPRDSQESSPTPQFKLDLLLLCVLWETIGQLRAGTFRICSLAAVWWGGHRRPGWEQGKWILQELNNNNNKDRDLSKSGEKECHLEKVSSWEGELDFWNEPYIYIHIYSKCIKNVEHSEFRKGQGFKRTGFLLPLLGQNYRENSSLITWHLQLIFPTENLAFHPSIPFLTESLS